MEVLKLKNAIIDLIKYADKEVYFFKNDLFLEINSPDSRFSIYTFKDGVISITIYFSDAIYYKFFIDTSGMLLTEKGSTPELMERFGINYILNLLNSASTTLLVIGKNAIDLGNYIFRDTSNDKKIEEMFNTKKYKNSYKIH